MKNVEQKKQKLHEQYSKDMREELDRGGAGRVASHEATVALNMNMLGSGLFRLMHKSERAEL